MICEAGEEALELGLLFGTENLTPQEEETDVLCFPHLLIQEFVGGYFLSKLEMVCLIVVFFFSLVDPGAPGMLPLNQLNFFSCFAVFDQKNCLIIGFCLFSMINAAPLSVIGF